jgi:hypothetical protein
LSVEYVVVTSTSISRVIHTRNHTGIVTKGDFGKFEKRAKKMKMWRKEFDYKNVSVDFVVSYFTKQHPDLFSVSGRDLEGTCSSV